MTRAQLSLSGIPEPETGDRDHWTTPRDLFEPLNREFRFGIDLAASESNALCRRFYTADDDALIMPWPMDCWCFLNPPFSKLPPFLSEVHEQNRTGVRVVVVVPGHRHEQAWFHDYVIGCASEIRIPRGRINYGAPGGIASSSAAFPSMVLVYGLMASRSWTATRSL